MKKCAILLLMTIAFIGCKPKQQVTNTHLDKKSEVAIKGNWTITSVNFPGSDYLKMTAFDVADSKCFVGSTWKFISNNNKGDFALNSPNCGAFASPITWYVNEEGNFVMKILNETKSKKVTEGYVLRVANQTETSFQLLQNMSVGGKMVDVVYQFQKVNQ